MTAKRRGRGRPAIPLTWRMMTPPEVAAVVAQVGGAPRGTQLHWIQVMRGVRRYDAIDVENDLVLVLVEAVEDVLNQL
jgi:hypothetical protein